MSQMYNRDKHRKFEFTTLNDRLEHYTHYWNKDATKEIIEL